MPRNNLILILALVVAAIVAAVILLWRTDAQAQESSVAEQLVATARENLEPFGIEFGAEFLGVVENVENTAAQLSGAEEAFFYVEKGQIITQTVGGLIERAGDTEAEAQMRSLMREGMRSGDFFYRVFFGGGSSYLTISPDGDSYSGAVARLSRLKSTSYDPKSGPSQPQAAENDACARKVLTRNIFGQAAEQIEVCVRAYCAPPDVDDCEILRIEPRSWWFGRVFADPDATPVSGAVHRSYCRGPVKYKWGVGLGAVRTSKYGDYEVENLSMGGQGTIMPEISCRP